MATILIAGGTGMIGKELSKVLLGKGYRVIILTRGEKKQDDHPNLSFAKWDPSPNVEEVDGAVIQEADYIINLAGANVGEKRWTEKRKRELKESRVYSNTTIVAALKKYPNKVKAVIQASGIDWYPADPTIPNPTPFTEDVPHGNHFLGELCNNWEGSMRPVESMGKRLVILRTGIVLGKYGGALDQFEKPVRFGVAAILGNGKQMISWIHIDDIVRLYLDAIENEAMAGVYNAVAPNPVSNKTMMKTLAQIMVGRFYLPMYVPAFALKLVLGEMSSAVLKSTTVSCDKLRAQGFTFQYADIEPALTQIEKG